MSLCNKLTDFVSGVREHINDAPWKLARKGRLYDLSIVDFLTRDIGELIGGAREFGMGKYRPNYSLLALAIPAAAIVHQIAYQQPAYCEEQTIESGTLLPSKNGEYKIDKKHQWRYTNRFCEDVKEFNYDADLEAYGMPPLNKMKLATSEECKNWFKKGKHAATQFYAGDGSKTIVILDTDNNNKGDILLLMTDSEYESLRKQQ